MRPLLPLLLVLAAGCQQRIGGGDGDYLQLQGFTLVDPDEGRLRGFLRWAFVTADPSRVDEPTARCETWEALDLHAVAPVAACPDCAFQFEGEAAVDDSDCDDVTWTRRAFSLGFAPFDAVDDTLGGLEADGYVWAVLSRWSPDLGTSEGFQGLFGAKPEVWDDSSGALGSGADEALAGEHILDSAWYWDLTE